jgi:integrase
VLYYVDRKTKSEGLGTFPEMGVKAARDAAGAFRANVKTWLADRSKPSPAAKQNFKEVAEQFLKREVDGKLLSAPQITAMLQNSVYPSWETEPFETLRRGDVTKLLDEIEEERGPRAADMALAYIRRIAQWYQARHDDYTSPVVKGMARTKPSQRRRKRILTDDEIRSMWKACEELGAFGALVKMLLLTAQRRTKVATMKWDDLDGAIWTIEVIDRQKGTGERLKLPRVALDIIEKQRKVRINDYVFPASRVGRRDGPGKEFGSFSAFGQGKADLDDLMVADFAKQKGVKLGGLDEDALEESRKKLLPRWILHDLRRTAKSCMSRAGVRPDISERVLGHAIEGVEGVYDQHDYDEQRAGALVKLADLITRIVKPTTGNVVSIRG